MSDNTAQRTPPKSDNVRYRENICFIIIITNCFNSEYDSVMRFQMELILHACTGKLYDLQIVQFLNVLAMRGHPNLIIVVICSPDLCFYIMSVDLHFFSDHYVLLICKVYDMLAKQLTSVFSIY